MKKKPNIEFVSYDGAYPCLCHGEFKVKIDGELYCFHYRYGKEDSKNNCFSDFWASGGHVRFDKDWQEDVSSAPWELNSYVCNHFPKKLKDIVPELLDVFNENVPEGCCGGCV